MHRILLFLLAFFARAIITRHRPYVIGVTGSVGKTTLSTNIAAYLKSIYTEKAVEISPYHYNGEYGLPLTIIGAKTGGKNPFLWIRVFVQALITYIRPYPRYLVLEYGIDHPGEMEYLISIVRPHIAILSPVAPNHLEQFGTFERYHQAKLLLIESALDSAIAHESEKSYISREGVYFYGRDILSYAHILSSTQELSSLSVDLRLQDRDFHIDLPVFGEYQGENILPLYIIADRLQIDPETLAQKSHLFAPEEGRSRLLAGVAGTSIIDGSYNGGYESIIRGIESLVPFTLSGKVYCLLGDMRELGGETQRLHRELAQDIDEKFGGSPNVSFFLVGPGMRDFVAPLLSVRYSVITSLSSRSIGNIIASRIHTEIPAPLIYVKGSQNTIFLEEAIACFLSHHDERRLLCRQSPAWKRKKDRYFSHFTETIQKL